MRIQKELQYKSTALKNIIEQLSGEQRFYPLKLQEIKFDNNYQIAVFNYLEMISKQVNNGEIKTIYGDFLYGLGKTDIYGQIKHCEVCYERADTCLNEFNSEYKTKNKLYISIGIYAGLALFFILI